jgi:hypothetical protein
MAPRSYIAAAFVAERNRTAAAITLAIALAVLALGRVPQPGGSEVDLRVPERVDGWTQASLFGFGAATDQGRPLEAIPARIVWNRPLPEHFTLALDAVAETPRAQLRVWLGDRQELVSLSRRGPTNLEFDNPQGLRELRLAPVPAAARIQLRRAAVR